MSVERSLCYFCCHSQNTVKQRWYSVELSAWFIYALHSFSGVQSLITPDTSISFFPGDDVSDIVDNADDHKKKCSKRMDQLREFIGCCDFNDNLVTCCVSSTVRWEFARGIQTSLEEHGPNKSGLSEGINRMMCEARSIFLGRKDLAEYILRREPNEALARLDCSSSIMASILYICENSSGQRDPFWLIMRGEIEPCEIGNYLSRGNCCADSGVMAKLYQYFHRLDKAYWAEELEALEKTLCCMRSVYLAKGGCSNLSAEAAFSLCRMLGLKLPYRPVKLSVYN